MIDHLIKFDTEQEAVEDSIVGLLYDTGWDSSISLPGATVRYITTDTLLPYWYIIIAKDTVDDSLSNHPNCVLVTDRDAAANGKPFVISSVIPEDQLGDYQVSPVFAGSQYNPSDV